MEIEQLNDIFFPFPLFQRILNAKYYRLKDFWRNDNYKLFKVFISIPFPYIRNPNLHKHPQRIKFT